jgi:hypothetical protein
MKHNSTMSIMQHSYHYKTITDLSPVTLLDGNKPSFNMPPGENPIAVNNNNNTNK